MIAIKFIALQVMYLMYDGQDFGANFFGDYTSFKVWSPAASRIKVVIYENYFEKDGIEHDMSKTEADVWALKLQGNYKNKYYNYRVTIGDVERETTDPYAKGASLNGNRGMIVDFKSINPKGWENHSLPTPLKPTDAVIYEMHIRDFSMDENSGIENQGKYLAFTEEGTRIGMLSTGLDHLKELGVTHIHFLPIFDYSSVDERLDKGYNWGYDPYLYHVPEGSYATNPYDGTVRIRELKKLIKKLHENNLRIIMDVVFNHTSDVESSPFQILAPDYYYRIRPNGTYSNGSGCGNEIATEKPMVRKFIVDCLRFWTEEYKIDGFRFDLMALMDIDTVVEIKHQLATINPNILLYGEPWTGGESLLEQDRRFMKGCQKGLQIALFNDDFRNAIKGDNDGSGCGFVNGAQGLEHDIKKGVVGSIPYDDFLMGYAQEPGEVINYVSSHDNLTLYDKIRKTHPESSELEFEQMNRLALSIVLTAQGIPFIHGGSEFLRSKQGNANSYNAGDHINKINWCDKSKYLGTFLYIKGLIEIRKMLKVLRMDKSEEIKRSLIFIDSPPNTVAFLLKSYETDSFNNVFIVHNASQQMISVNTPLPGTWTVLADGQQTNRKGIVGKVAVTSPIKIEPLTTYIMAQQLKNQAKHD